jgi:hypothetical protein
MYHLLVASGPKHLLAVLLLCYFAYCITFKFKQTIYGVFTTHSEAEQVYVNELIIENTEPKLANLHR